LKITRIQEDYLKIIWHLTREMKKATVTLVATGLEVSSPTVLAMFRQLEKNEQITYNKSDGAFLTSVGEELARKLVRKHRLIETFLETVLDMDEQQVHEEAEKLEHVISDQLLILIDSYLGFPDKDPHGSIIPAWEKVKRIKLVSCQLEASFTINEMDFSTKEKEYYQSSDLIIGSNWTVVETPPGNCILIGNGKRFLALPSEIAERIVVTLRK